MGDSNAFGVRLSFGQSSPSYPATWEPAGPRDPRTLLGGLLQSTQFGVHGTKDLQDPPVMDMEKCAPCTAPRWCERASVQAYTF